MFVDTHCHLNMMVKKEFDAPLKRGHFDEIFIFIEEARAAGVEKIINVGTSLPESLNSVEIAKRFERVFATVGIHPCDAKEDWKKDFDEIKGLIKNRLANKIVGIGETGLDYYHKPFNREQQIDVFKAHIKLALEHDLPLVIHVRDAVDDVLMVLEGYPSALRGVNHCFQHGRDVADQFLQKGFYLGINAPITYPKNESFRELLKTLKLKNILLETDAPFLPPQQFRGKPNHPKYIPIFAELLAEIKEVSLEELAKITTANAKTVFGV